MRRLLPICFSIILCSVACGDDSTPLGDAGSMDAGSDARVRDADAASDAASDAGSDSGVPNECAIGATRCDINSELQTCTDGLTWGDATTCAEGSLCLVDECQELTESQLAQVEVLERYADDLRDYTGHPEVIDTELLKATIVRRVLLGDGSDYEFAKAIYTIFRTFPHGHGAIGFGALDYSDCVDEESAITLQHSSWYGVCGRASGDTSMITYAADGNPLGLAPGDKVVRVLRGDVAWEGPGFLVRVGQEPVCSSSIVTESARVEQAAINLFGMLQEGDRIEVERTDGSTESLDVPPRLSERTRCRDPFHREERRRNFATYQRPDGIVVIILPTLGDHPDHPFPSPLTETAYRNWIAESIDLINTDLESYDVVAGVVWDIRGNSGGAQELGAALMGPLGDTPGGLGNCYARVPESSPPEFGSSAEYPIPYPIFVDDPLPAFAFADNQAIVADGTSVSAADWMLLRARAAGVPIFGHGSMGAFGYQVGESFVDRSINAVPGVHVGLSSFISGANCVDAEGVALEGRVLVDTVVDFDASDLAAGIDTQLEAAAASLL